MYQQYQRKMIELKCTLIDKVSLQKQDPEDVSHCLIRQENIKLTVNVKEFAPNVLVCSTLSNTSSSGYYNCFLDVVLANDSEE